MHQRPQLAQVSWLFGWIYSPSNSAGKFSLENHKSINPIQLNSFQPPIDNIAKSARQWIWEQINHMENWIGYWAEMNFLQENGSRREFQVGLPMIQLYISLTETARGESRKHWKVISTTGSCHEQEAFSSVRIKTERGKRLPLQIPMREWQSIDANTAARPRLHDETCFNSTSYSWQLWKSWRHVYNKIHCFAECWFRNDLDK